MQADNEVEKTKRVNVDLLAQRTLRCDLAYRLQIETRLPGKRLTDELSEVDGAKVAGAIKEAAEPLRKDWSR